MIELAFLSVLIVVCLYGAIVVTVILRRSNSNGPDRGLSKTLQDGFAAFDRTLRDEFVRARDGATTDAKTQRDEVRSLFTSQGDATVKSLEVQANRQVEALGSFQMALDSIGKSLIDSSANLKNQVVENINLLSKTMHDSLASQYESQKVKIDSASEAIRVFGDSTQRLVEAMNKSQQERLEVFSTTLGSLSKQLGDQSEQLRALVQDQLNLLRNENAEKLESMRKTVDEKLQGTLEQRLGDSFKMVSERLEQVHKSIGEMQALATGVGDLKRVLTNIKTRGVWSEVSLENLLEQMLSPEQYAKNVEITPRSGRRVEFAVRLPGNAGDSIWLPIDAKFPIEDYDRLVQASEAGDSTAIQLAAERIEARIRDAAKDISTKYVDPPHSTDFAILFIPTEGLYSEVLRRPGLTDSLQRDHRIVVAGPTNLGAFLTTLRIGFRTLAIEKRTSEVWHVLGAAKTEFEKYGAVLEKVKKRLEQASNEIDQAAVRQRAIKRTLSGVEALPEVEAQQFIKLSPPSESEDDLISITPNSDSLFDFDEGGQAG